MLIELPKQLFFLPTEMNYKSIYRDFLAGLKEGNPLRTLKYDAYDIS